MTTEQIVQSWKDEDYNRGLSAAEQALIPDNPAGLVELTDEELMGVQGGAIEYTGQVCVTIIATVLLTIATA